MKLRTRMRRPVADESWRSGAPSEFSALHLPTPFSALHLPHPPTPFSALHHSLSALRSIKDPHQRLLILESKAHCTLVCLQSGLDLRIVGTPVVEAAENNVDRRDSLLFKPRKAMQCGYFGQNDTFHHLWEG